MVSALKLKVIKFADWVDDRLFGHRLHQVCDFVACSSWWENGGRCTLCNFKNPKECLCEPRHHEFRAAIYALEQAHLRHPQQRLGQLLSNATDRRDLFYVESDVLAEMVEKY